MDRVIVYPGTVLQDTDILGTNKNAMISDAFIMQSVFGANVLAAGMGCSPGPGLSVVIAPGTLNQVSTVDSTAYGSLAADTSDVLLKTGINLSPTTLLLTPPAEAGWSINYLIEAQLVESDAEPLPLAYYDAANPSVPYTGPGNTGASTNTLRIQRVQLQTAAGSLAASTGAQTTPAPDAGFVGLWVVTVASGQSSITASDIVKYPTAPFAPFLLQELRPGFSSQRVFAFANTGQNWTAPSGVSRVRVRLWAGGGAGGDGGGVGYVGGGGAGGEYIEANLAVNAGQSYLITVGAGGISGMNNGVGGSTSFGSLATATGGGGGGAGSSGSVGTGGNYGGSSGLGAALQGDPIILPGGGGGNVLTFGSAAVLISGTGGGSGFSGTGAPIAAAAAAGSINGQTTNTPGCGGSGGIGTGVGGIGANGLVVVEW